MTKLAGTKFTLGAEFAVTRGSQVSMSSPVSVRRFGARGDGTTNDAAALQEMVTHCATYGVRGVIDVPLNLSNTTISIASDTDIECIGAGKLINGAIDIAGTLGAEINVTDDSLKGATTINAPGTTFSAGDVLFIRSCINCLSSDAGVDQLGVISGTSSYFAEFVVVESVTGSTIVIENPLLFTYTLAPGAESGPRTVSTVAKVAFAENIRLRNIVMEGRKSGALQSILVSYGRDVEISGDFSDTGATGYMVRFHRSLNCEVSRATSKRPAYSQIGSPASSYNHFLTTGSQQCGFRNLTCIGGYQCVDFTFWVSAGNQNPSISCYVRDSQFTQCLDGATSHAGCWNCIFENVHTLNSERGFRLRSRNDVLSNFSCINTTASNLGTGVFLEDGYHSGTVVANGVITGFLYGLQIDADNPDGAVNVRGGQRISGLTISECTKAITIPAITATALATPMDISDITAIRCASGIFVGAYVRGVTIRDLTCVGPFSDRGGIEWGANVVDLTIDGATFANLGAFYGLRGPSTSAFISDTDTFAGGNADANLSIRNVRFVGLTATYEATGIIRDATAFASGLEGFNQSYTIGAAKVRLQTSQTADLQEWQNASGTKLLGVSDTGKLTGTIAVSVKDAVAAAADVAALKTALAGLFD